MYPPIHTIQYYNNQSNTPYYNNSNRDTEQALHTYTTTPLYYNTVQYYYTVLLHNTTIPIHTNSTIHMYNTIYIYYIRYTILYTILYYTITKTLEEQQYNTIYTLYNNKNYNTRVDNTTQHTITHYTRIHYTITQYITLHITIMGLRPNPSNTLQQPTINNEPSNKQLYHTRRLALGRTPL